MFDGIEKLSALEIGQMLKHSPSLAYEIFYNPLVLRKIDNTMNARYLLSYIPLEVILQVLSDEQIVSKLSSVNIK